MTDGQADKRTDGQTDKRTVKQRLRGCFLNFALLGFVFLLMFIVGEVAVRLIMPQQLIQMRPDIWMPTDTLGWISRPGVNATINTGERTVRVVTDERGLRVGERGLTRAPNRVLLIGDSFMQALQVEHEQSAAALLEADLTAATGRPFAVWNAGVDGWDPAQYLIRARQLMAADTFAALVVVLYLGNDVVPRRVAYRAPRQPAERARLRLPRSLSKNEMVDALFYPVNNMFEERSHLFVLLKNRLRVLLQRVGLSADYVPFGILKHDAESAAWDTTAAMVADIKAAAEARGVPALFVMIPAPETVDSALAGQLALGFGLPRDSLDLDLAARLLGEKLRARGIEPLDLLPIMRAEAAGPPLFGSVDRHLSPEGHVMLARAIAQQLQSAPARPR